MHSESLCERERRHLRDHGYVIVREAIPLRVLTRAQRRVAEALPPDEHRLLAPPELATHPEIIALIYESCLASILERTMGPFPPLISSQVAVLPPGYLRGGAPGTHVDGGWSGPLPERADEIDPVTHRPRDAARWFGENDEKRGSNDGLLWMDPDRRLSYGSYTALVGVCLSEQMTPGHGQLGVLDGLHEMVEACFRAQRDAGSIVGPEGLDWPRVRIDANGRPYMNGLPDRVRARAAQMAKENEPPRGWRWPELTPVLMAPGDAVIALHALPHTPTPNHGPNPRRNVYFRVRRLRPENPHEGSRRIGHGVSDHPDRGYFGQFLDYPPDYDPWQTSIDKLCDHWSEWDGMQDVLREGVRATP